MLGYPWSEGARAVLEGLLNGTLQSLALACVLFPLVRVLAPSNPGARHLLWLAALVTTLGLHVAATIASLGRGAARALPLENATSTTAAEIGWQMEPGSVTAAGPARFLVEIPGSGWLPALMAVLLLVVSIRLLLVIRGLHHWRLLRARSEPLPDYVGAVAEAVPEGGGRRLPEVRVSREVICPVTMGYRRPTILLPPSLPGDLSPLELRQILAHEVAHVRRYDDWANLAQRLIETLLFFNPAVVWIGRRMEMERELACDQHVLARVGGPKVYASCLLRLATMARFPASGLVSGAAACRLTERVEAMLRAPESTPARWPSLALGAVPAVVLLIAVAQGSLPLSVAIAEPGRSAVDSSEFLAPHPRMAGELAASPRRGDTLRMNAGIPGVSVGGDASGSGASTSVPGGDVPEAPGGTSPIGTSEATRIATDHVPEVASYACGAASGGGCGRLPSTLPEDMVRPVAARPALPSIAGMPQASERPRRGLNVVARGSGRAPRIGTPGDSFEQPRKSGLTTSGTSTGMMPDNRPTVDDLSPMRLLAPAPGTWLR